MKGHVVRERGVTLRLIVGISACIFGLGFAGGANAASDEDDTRPQVILGAVRDQYKDEAGKKIVDNVPGVEVIITTEDGEEIARLITDDGVSSAPRCLRQATTPSKSIPRRCLQRC